jgi:hypothetical protein
MGSTGIIPPDIQFQPQTMPDLGQPDAPLPTLAPDPTQQLENVAARAPGQLGQSLQNLQQQATQQQQPQQPQQPDALASIQQDLVNRYQQNALPPARGGQVKRLLSNFIGSMAHGLLPVEQNPEFQRHQALQDLVNVSQAQSLAGLRDAQTQNLQLVTRAMPDGTQIQIPQAHVATFDAAMAKGYEANQKPLDLNDLIGRTVYGAVQQGRDPNTDPVVQQLLQVQKGLQKPPADTVALQKENFMTGIQPAIAANEITPPMLTDVRQLVTGIQRSKAIPPSAKPQLVSYLLANNTPASTGTNAQVKITLEQQAKSGNAVYAFDPHAQQTILTTAGDAQERALQAVRPVKEADIRNDTHDTRVLNDVASKSNNLMAAAGALDQNADQRARIAWAMGQADKDNQFRIGAFGANIPTTWMNNLLHSSNMSGATQATRDYVTAVLSLREASMGLQKVLTGSARANEAQINALQATVPALETDSSFARQKMGAFVQNIEMLRQGIPKIPGVDSIPISGAQAGNTPGVNLTPPKAADAGMKWQHRTINGNTEWRQVPQ